MSARARERWASWPPTMRFTINCGAPPATPPPQPPTRSENAALGCGQIHAPAAGAAGSESRLPWSANRRGMHGRLRQEHATVFAEALARDRRLPAALHGVELVAAGEVRDAPGQTAPAADSDDVFPAARRGFCGPLRATDHALAPGRLSRPRRSLHLHGVCARRLARLPSTLAAQPLSLRAYSRHHILFSL